MTIFVDHEITGRSPRDDGITEIGAIVLKEGEPTNEWSTQVWLPGQFRLKFHA